MDRILFINACIRPDSRTLELTKTLLQKLNGEKEEIKLFEKTLQHIDMNGINQRTLAAKNNDFTDPSFDFAKQFSSADIIVIAAPYWDLMFPAVLKTYLENITVYGITFKYSQEGIPQGLCKAKALYYVTTSGGFIGNNDFGFSYVKSISENFFGIKNVKAFTAEGLDVFGADIQAIMDKAKQAILTEKF